MKKFLIFIILLGLVLLVVGSTWYYSTITVEKHGEKVIESLYKKGDQAPKKAQKQAPYSIKNVKNLNTSDLKKYAADTNVKQYVAGKIDMPALNIYLPILEGVSNRNLAVGAATLKANQSLEQGNFALAGHHMRNPSLLFGSLPKAKKGNMITITYNGKSAKYVVTKVELINAYDGYVIHDSEGDRIATLITCDATGKNRYMVRAEQV